MRGGGDRTTLLSNCLASARARSWRRSRRGINCPAAGPFGPWDVLDRRCDPGVAAGVRRRSAQRSEACKACSRAIATCSDESRPPARLRAGVLSAERFRSGRPGSCLRLRERVFRERATSAWRVVGGLISPDHGGHGACHGATHGFSRRRARRAASWPGFRGGVGRQGSGSHQGGRAERKRQSVEKNQI